MSIKIYNVSFITICAVATAAGCEVNMSVESRACPVCKNAERKRELFRRDFEGMEEIVPYSSYKVVVCESCGTIYADNIKKSILLSSYYKTASKYEADYLAISKFLQRVYKRGLEFMMPYITPMSRILDIGCGNGGFLRLLQERGYENLTGLEPSSENCMLIEKNFGIKTVCGYVGKDMPLKKKYDVVMLQGVLEHIIPVDEFLKQCLKCLSEDGILYIAVPDVNSFADNPDLYQQFSVEHINYFSIESLRNLMVCLNYTLMGTCAQEGVLYTLWKRENNIIRKLLYDSKGYASMMDYLKNTETMKKEIQMKLKRYVKKKIYIWGAGTHTATLYQLGMLKDINVEGIIDSNSHYRNRICYGHRILSPDEFAKASVSQYPILISSRDAKQSILMQIRDSLRLPNEIIELY